MSQRKTKKNENAHPFFRGKYYNFTLLKMAGRVRKGVGFKMKKKLSPSIEDYLEVITLLSKEDDVVRVKDISKKLKVSKPSVHSALHTLKDNELITHKHYGYVKLTEKGKDTGKNICDAHQILIKFLTKILNVKQDVAEEDACKIEHNISNETLSKLIESIKFVETTPSGFPDWSKSFNYFLKTGKRKIYYVR